MKTCNSCKWNKGKLCDIPNFPNIEVNKWLTRNQERGKNNIPTNPDSDCPGFETSKPMEK